MHVSLRDRRMDNSEYSWVKAACIGVFLPMVVNLLVLATYLLRSS